MKDEFTRRIERMEYDMDKLLKRLKDIIEQQLKLLEVIKSVEKAKNEILSTGKLMDFSEMNENLSTMIEENALLDSKRESILHDIAQSINMEKSTIRFKSLLEKTADSRLKNELNRIYETLKNEVADIKHLSKMNQELIEVAIQIIDLSLEQEGISEKEIDYTQNRDMKQERSLLINKII